MKKGLFGSSKKSVSEDNPSPPPTKRSALTAAREAIKDPSAAVKGAKEAIKGAKDVAKHSISAKVDAKADEFLEKSVMKVLTNAGEMVKEGAKAPGMPDFMNNYIDEAHEFLWDDVEKELLEGIMLKYGRADNEYKQTSLAFWADTRPTFWPKGETFPWVWRWARARFLHATQPADCTLFQNLREAGPLMLTVISLYPLTSVPLFFFTLIFINKTDEFQLVNFILKFKGAQFISAGIIPAAQTGMKLFFSCFKNVAVNDHDYESLLPEGMCVITAPGPSKWHLLVLEPLRIVLLYIAAYLLYKGGYGGIEEIKALEAARTDAADGCLDGVVDKKVLKEKGKEARGQGTPRNHAGAHADPRSASPVEHSSTPRDHREKEEITFEAKNAAIGIARLQYKAKVCNGFMLPSFLLYDFCVVLTLTFAFGMALFSVEEPGWMVWTCAYYFRMIYSVFSFPFLVFLIPIVGPSLHHAKPTAYDKQGMLVPKLNTGQIKLMMENAAKDKAFKEAGGVNPKHKKSKEQAAEQGKALIGKVTQGAKAGVKGAKEAGGAASAGVASQKNKLVKQKSSLGTAGGGALKRQGTATDMV